MSTYAGFQKYETPNLGQEAANMLTTKQQMDAKKAQQESENAYKNMELGIKLQKEQRDALSANDETLNKTENSLRQGISKINPAGFATTHSALTDWTTNMMTANANDARAVRGNQLSMNEYTQDNQARLGEIDKFAKVGDILNTAATEMGKAKNPNAFTQFVFQKYARAGSPSNDEPTSYETKKVGRGVMQSTITTYQKDENGNMIPLISAPLDKLYEVANVTNWEAPNYDAEAAADATKVGIDLIETTTKGGGTRKDYNPLVSPKFIESRERWVNSKLSNESQAPDFYVKYVNPHANFIMSTAPESEKKRMAALQGYPDDPSKADFIIAEQDPQTGNIIAKFTDKQKAAAKAQLEEIYNSKVARKVDITTPHITNINAQTINQKDDTVGKQYDEAARLAKAGDFSKFNDFITFGKVNGSINPDDNVLITVKNPDGSDKMEEYKKADGTIGKRVAMKSVPTFTYDYKNNKAKIWILKSNDEPEQVTIDLNNESDVRTKMGLITGAEKMQSANKATQPIYNKVPVNAIEK
jgi:hypothetical protein